MADNRIIGPTAPPGLQDIVNSILSQALTGTNCAKVGTIESYDPEIGTATVSINSKVELTDGRVFDYPLLVDCPVFMLQGGTSYLSMPISEGDQCIVVFNDFDIDNWFYSGTAALPATSRKHSISDGLVFVGLRNITQILPLLSNVVELNAGANKLALGNAVVSLFGLMNQFIDVVSNALVQGPNPSIYPLTPATIAALQALKIQFALLLDQGNSPT